MKSVAFIVSVVLVTFMVGCSSVRVKTDFDPEYDINAFKTYRWATGDEVNPEDELQKEPLIYKRLIAAIDKVLAEKGMTLVGENETPDVVLVTHAGVKERMRVHQTVDYHGWYSPWWGPYGGSTHVSYYDETTLVVDIVSWETKELAWRGTATGVFGKNLSREKQEKLLDEIAQKVFADYPPGSGS